MNWQTPVFFVPDYDSSGIPICSAKDVVLHAIYLVDGGGGILVQTKDHNLLFDIGGCHSGVAPQAEASPVITYLTSLGLTTIDLLVITHPHPDHVGYGYGGIGEFLKHFTVSKIWSTGAPYPLWYNNAAYTGDVDLALEEYYGTLFPDGYTSGALGVVPGITGDCVLDYHEPRNIATPEVHSYGDLTVNVLHPAQNLTSASLNNDSIVCQLLWGDVKILLVGDLEAAGNTALLNGNAVEILPSDLLQIGHHGVINCITENFINAVNPQYAFVQPHNGPDATVKALFSTKGIPIYDTKVNRADIVFRSDGTSVGALNPAKRFNWQMPTM